MAKNQLKNMLISINDEFYSIDINLFLNLRIRLTEEELIKKIPEVAVKKNYNIQHLNLINEFGVCLN